MTTPDPTPFPDGIDPEDVRKALRSAGIPDNGRDLDQAVRNVLLLCGNPKPTPTMPPLPTEPTSVRVTTKARTVDAFWDGESWGIAATGPTVHRRDITSWSPLTTDAETLEKVDVEALREVVRRRHGVVELDGAVWAFLARVDEVQGR